MQAPDSTQVITPRHIITTWDATSSRPKMVLHTYNEQSTKTIEVAFEVFDKDDPTSSEMINLVSTPRKRFTIKLADTIHRDSFSNLETLLEINGREDVTAILKAM